MKAQIVVPLSLVCALATLANSGLLSLGILNPTGNTKMQEFASFLRQRFAENSLFAGVGSPLYYQAADAEVVL
ncbi:MAG: hypothetical protein ACAI44_06925 [Candidatus Sericytochromatia bacterium]